MPRFPGPLMPPAAIAVLLLVAAYLIGALPFGYLVGRLRGVDLFREGSGNIGATNAGRVLGRKYGVLVFLLDFLKGAVPTAAAVPVAAWLAPGAEIALGPADVLRVGAAGLAFLGHLYPVYLRFRGGKGVATGAGTILVLVPGPTLLAVLAWFVVVLASRTVSLGSLAAVAVLAAVRLVGEPGPFAPDALPVTAYCLFGAGLVALKHRGNVRRLVARSENRVGDFSMRQPLLRGLHVVALGLWFGGAAFFNFVVAPLVFDSFRQVVRENASDRTAYLKIVPDGTSEKKQKALSSALAGAAVGPVFPYYFGMLAVCGLVSLVTAAAWWGADDGRGVHQWRVILLTVAVLLVAVSWPISQTVSDLRVARFDGAREAEAEAAFKVWHWVSLGLSLVTTALAGVALAMAAVLPQKTDRGGAAPERLSQSGTHATLGPSGKTSPHAALGKGDTPA